jgi:uncharacterized protein YhfF
MSTSLNQESEKHQCCRTSGEVHQCKNSARNTITLTSVNEHSHEDCGCKQEKKQGEGEQQHQCCREKNQD